MIYNYQQILVGLDRYTNLRSCCEKFAAVTPDLYYELGKYGCHWVWSHRGHLVRPHKDHWVRLHKGHRARLHRGHRIRLCRGHHVRPCRGHCVRPCRGHQLY